MNRPHGFPESLPAYQHCPSSPLAAKSWGPHDAFSSAQALPLARSPSCPSYHSKRSYSRLVLHTSIFRGATACSPFCLTLLPLAGRTLRQNWPPLLCIQPIFGQAYKTLLGDRHVNTGDPLCRSKDAPGLPIDPMLQRSSSEALMLQGIVRSSGVNATPGLACRHKSCNPASTSDIPSDTPIRILWLPIQITRCSSTFPP